MPNRQLVLYEGATDPFVLLPGLLTASGNYWTLIALAPAAHAASHAAAGTDPLTLSESQVTNLVADLAARLLLAGGSLTGILNSNSQLFLTGTGNLRLGIGFGAGNFSSANAVFEAKPHASSRLTFYDNINGAAHNPALALACLATGGRGMALFADTTSSAFIFDGAGNFDIASDTQANIRTGTFGAGVLRLRVTGAGATEVPAGGSLSVGGGTALTKAVVYTPTLTPTQIVVAGLEEQTFTVTGLTTADTVTVNQPAPTANSTLISARVSAANTLAVVFFTTAATTTPSAGIYRIVAIRS